MLIYPEALNSFMCEFSVVDITRYSTLIGISLLTTHNSLILIYKVVKIWNVLLLNINIRILPNNIAFNQYLKKYHQMVFSDLNIKLNAFKITIVHHV